MEGDDGVWPAAQLAVRPINGGQFVRTERVLAFIPNQFPILRPGVLAPLRFHSFFPAGYEV
jgi:hypothetical protein